MDTIRLDFKDPTWSNVDVAIWNMIESHIGAVAANIPLMGPLITIVGRQIHSLTSTSSSKDNRSHGRGIPKEARQSSGIFEHKFRRMKDEGLGDSSIMAVNSPVVQGRASKPNDEAYAMDQLGERGIRVQTDVEQSYDSRMPGTCIVHSVV